MKKKIILLFVFLLSITVSVFADHYQGRTSMVRASFDGGYNYTNWVYVTSDFNIYTALEQVTISSDVDINVSNRSFVVNYYKKQQVNYSNSSITEYSNYYSIKMPGYDLEGHKVTVWLNLYYDMSAYLFFEYSNVIYEYLIPNIQKQ